MTRQVTLASSSKYRRELLERLRVSFNCISPEIDETERLSESPLQTCIRLAREKALAIANAHPANIVIGSDQVADVQGKAVSKPGTHENARKQLTEMSGQSIVFHTAVCVVCLDASIQIEYCIPTTVEFRILTDVEIERYLNAEKPYDCAGSAKSEGLGIALLKRIQSEDPTALIGLPLIKLADALRKAGVALP